MPSANNPDIPEFYVYCFKVEGIPFYVGIGRAARASDRIPYIDRCIEREKKGATIKWKLECSVIVALRNAGYRVTYEYVVKNVVRATALKRERAEIGRLLAEGAILANLQHNPKRAGSASEVINPLLA